MAKPARTLSTAEISQAFAPDGGSPLPPIVSPQQLAAACGVSVKTIYQWIAQGRLDGAFRKRGKHNLIWRDRAIANLFNGPDWK